MTAAIRATLGGVPLQIRDGETHSWSLTTGAQPFTRVFQLTRHRAEAIFDRAGKQLSLASTSGTRTRDKQAEIGPLAFVLERPGKPKLEIKGLFVTEVRPGDDPLNTVGLLVSDRRWLLLRELGEKSYNLRRKTTERRLIRGDLTPVEVAQNAPDYVYRRSTMDNGIPWTARRVLEDVLTELVGPGGFVLGDTPLQDSVEGLVLRGDNGVSAIERVLALLPGITLTSHEDGRLHLVQTLDQSEIAFAKSLGAPLRGSWSVVDRSLARPSRVYVYLDRESELRFDFLEDGGGTISPGREPLWLQNVIPCPDPELVLPSGKTVAYGTWLTVDEILEAWEAEGLRPSGAPELTQALIRRWYLQGFSHLHHVYSLATFGRPDPVWTRRINALQEHWRRTYRILPQWMDKIRSVRPYRAAILDQENGVRGRAEAFLDHTIKPSWKTLAMRTQPRLGWEVTGYADDLSEAEVSPATVDVLDSDNGILQVTLRVDPAGVGDVVVPGIIDGDVPTGTPGDLVVTWSQVGLDEDFRMAVVLTAIQDVPNGLGRLHQEDVKPEDVLGLLPGVGTIGTCKGADWHVFAGEETARTAWVDDRGDEIREAFYSGEAIARDLLINEDRVVAVSKAQAARVYAMLLDRGEGQFTVGLAPGSIPTGNVQSVTHSVIRVGQSVFAFTTVSMPPMTVQPSVWALMPEGPRRILRGLVQQ